MKPGNSITFFLLSIGALLHEINAAHSSKRRSDFESAYPPPSSYGWNVPLKGSESCDNTGFCYDTLPAPPVDSRLEYLTLARGTENWTCKGLQPEDTPLFWRRDTTLWDAAPIMANLPDEQQFHSLIPQLYEFDYAALRNSSLSCIGYMENIGFRSAFEIVGEGIFSVHDQQEVVAPERPHDNLQWAYFTNVTLGWNIYRVETIGGTPPVACDKHTGDFLQDYAAEYWFYRA